MIEKKYQKSEDIVSRKIADEVILVPIKSNVGDLDNIYTLNNVGARIWELIDGKRRLVDIKNVLAEEFEVDESQARKDLEEFTQGLLEIKALKEA
ncbi:MAG: PqqD family protein [Candidatus Omnitrophota bacterium]